ncbi:DEAD/DEAH box helicase, partial [Candidatus Bathyarchaeota archaeon]|nr:DEAD/DEAH box helicase [Candidatus Bathyarchaeota archaeon]
VVQHEHSFNSYIDIDNDMLAILTGDVGQEKREKAWNDATILFMTPQTLENDLRANLYDLHDVLLIIFDEAHRAVGDYSYTTIARQYIGTGDKAHVLALSASPGSEREKIEEIKQNLYIQHVEVRTDRDSDVLPYIQDVDFKWIKIDIPDNFKKIIDILNDELKKVKNFIKEKHFVENKDTKYITRKDFLEIMKKARMRLNHEFNMSQKQQLFTIIKVISVGLRISHCLELIETQGLQAILKYIEKCKREARKERSSKSLHIFIDLARRQSIHEKIKRLVEDGKIHPKLEYLGRMLQDFINSNPDSRIMVFANFRITVEAITNHLRASGIEKVSSFVGQQSRGGMKGMTQKKQEEILQQFKDGVFQVLIATSVAEEGLDIGECDLVVLYDIVPSAIRTIQRRGRTGRKRAGNVVALMARNTRDEAYYHVERAREKRMEQNLKNMGKKKTVNLDTFTHGKK